MNGRLICLPSSALSNVRVSTVPAARELDSVAVAFTATEDRVINRMARGRVASLRELAIAGGPELAIYMRKARKLKSYAP
jgi:hypothetical protein